MFTTRHAPEEPPRIAPGPSGRLWRPEGPGGRVLFLGVSGDEHGSTEASSAVAEPLVLDNHTTNRLPELVSFRPHCTLIGISDEPHFVFWLDALR